MRLLALIGLLAILVALAAAAYFFGGFYNVAASQPDLGPVKWALMQVRTASIARHAETDPPQGYDSADNVKAGARAFLQRGCTTCHGGPGVDWAKFSEGMRPDPPDLKDVAKNADPAELFWVIKNGINMTAMPSFGEIGVPDKEIWSIVAFVKKLPTVKDADFKAWTAPPTVTTVPSSPVTTVPPAGGAPAAPAPQQ